MMQSTTSTQAVEAETGSRSTAIRVTLAGGILGFEKHQTWLLITDPDEAPFQWFQAQDDLRLAFLVMPPFLGEPNYRPDVSAADVAFLNLRDPEDALVLNIVTLHNDGHATLNLKGPILLNRHTLIGKQIVPVNAADYNVQHPLPVVG